jgi:hypothetical protein
MVFTTLAHLMDEDFLTEAFHQLRKDAAAGIDQMTVEEYERNLRERITELHRKLVSREYRAQPAPASVDTQGGRGPATAGHPGAGGQDRATSGGDDLGSHLRAALLWVLVWFPASTQCSSGIDLPAATVSGTGHQLDY